MKISLEFDDLRDLLFEMPKLAQLLSDDKPFPERMAAAIEPDPKVMKIEIEPVNGTPFTRDQKEALRRVLIEFVKDPAAFEKSPETVAERVKAGLSVDRADLGREEPAQEATPEATASPDKPKKTKAAENTPPEEKPTEAPTEPQTAPAEAEAEAEEVTDAKVRAAFNKLMKNGRRDAVAHILKGFKAKNFSGLAPENYGKALKLANDFAKMSDDEYKEALKA